MRVQVDSESGEQVDPRWREALVSLKSLLVGRCEM